ncbi:hypothetical protein [Paenibacillus tarimensis]|uniref:hypothetical protein n=1 Tax=Paenibacillus tarimensis TaxID=416012 RepID=UPI001F1837F6|nr:hypothetical protein [Paenibacillus tarimensis]MCF2946035.1 hypothetical protein [Paenibacillus tarimensis]
MKKIILGCIAVVLLIPVLIGVYVYRIGFLDDKQSTTTIEISDIPAAMYVTAEPVMPDWKVKKVTAYNDGFVSPTCTIYFTNDIELLLSTSPVTYPGMDQLLVNTNLYEVYVDEQDAVFQYFSGGYYYSFKTKRGTNEQLVQQYIMSL